MWTFVFKAYFCLLFMAGTRTGLTSPSEEAKGHPNILFLVVDDLRPALGCYQDSDKRSSIDPAMHTPNLDALASRSLLLKKAYVQQALCNPSRSSFLTSRRPDTTRVFDNNVPRAHFRDLGGNFTTLPQFFKEKGYVTAGMGKIFHSGHPLHFDDPISWTEPYFHAPNYEYWSHSHRGSWAAIPKRLYEKKPLPDVQLKDHAVETLRLLAKNKEQPFFLAVGFHKPHIAMYYPEEYESLYPWDDLRVPQNSHPPKNMPDIAWNICKGLLSYSDIQKFGVSLDINSPNLPDHEVLSLRRAYYSTTSYVDDLVGEVVQEVHDLGLDSNTIISFIGDHGYHLGELGLWCKSTNFEYATLAPMIIHIPGRTNQGMISERLVEFVDLFPTLVEAAGFPRMPTCPEDSASVDLCTEGKSFLPLLSEQKEAGHWEDVAFSQNLRRESQVMGYSIRTTDFRYTEWAKFEETPQYRPLWDELVGEELYDHTVDPGENENVADYSHYSAIRQRLSQKLRAGWRKRDLDGRK